MTPNAVPPTTLPAINPGSGVTAVVSVTFTVTVVTPCGKTDAGPFLPVKRGSPGHAVVSPAEVKYALLVSESLADVQ